GQPAQSARVVVELVHDLSLAVDRHRRDAVLVEVRVPEPPLVPARSLAEVDAADQLLQFCHAPFLRSRRCHHPARFGAGVTRSPTARPPPATSTDRGPRRPRPPSEAPRPSRRGSAARARATRATTREPAT